MRSFALAFAFAALPLAARAAAGPEIGFRSGFTLPLGNLDNEGGGTALSDLFNGFIPLTADLGFRFTPNLYVGLTGTYAFGITKCVAGASCSGHDVALGLDVRYHALPGEQIDPWVGIGSGYEWLSETVAGPGSTADIGAKGFEFLHLQLGADFSMTPNLKVGPFVQLGLAQYSSEDLTLNGTPQPSTLNNKAIHELLTFGLRVAFLP